VQPQSRCGSSAPRSALSVWRSRSWHGAVAAAPPAPFCCPPARRGAPGARARRECRAMRSPARCAHAAAPSKRCSVAGQRTLRDAQGRTARVVRRNVEVARRRHSAVYAACRAQAQMFEDELRRRVALAAAFDAHATRCASTEEMRSSSARVDASPNRQIAVNRENGKEYSKPRQPQRETRGVICRVASNSERPLRMP